MGKGKGLFSESLPLTFMAMRLPRLHGGVLIFGAPGAGCRSGVTRLSTMKCLAGFYGDRL